MTGRIGAEPRLPVTDRLAVSRDPAAGAVADPLEGRSHRGIARSVREASEQMWQLTGEDQRASVWARSNVAAAAVHPHRVRFGASSPQGVLRECGAGSGLR